MALIVGDQDSSSPGDSGPSWTVSAQLKCLCKANFSRNVVQQVMTCAALWPLRLCHTLLMPAHSRSWKMEYRRCTKRTWLPVGITRRQIANVSFRTFSRTPEKPSRSQTNGIWWTSPVRSVRQLTIADSVSSFTGNTQRRTVWQQLTTSKNNLLSGAQLSARGMLVTGQVTSSQSHPQSNCCCHLMWLKSWCLFFTSH